MIQSFDGVAPVIDATAWIHPLACVIGEVRLAAGVSVWPSAVLRGDMGLIEVGACSNIQDGAVCHDTGGRSVTRIGQRVTVGHRAILHGCIVEDDCLVGMGAIVMDNAVVGRGSVIGAGTLIPAGRVIPPRSLVIGAPGKVAREVTEEESAWIMYSWRVYADRAEAWRAGRAATIG
jgi:carbonic anhydrase/acetyltransferase-like protein (isoleucine patch superfamily)